jgi:hypothetical protein
MESKMTKSTVKIGKPGEIKVGDTVAHKVPLFGGYNDICGFNTNLNDEVWTGTVKEIKDGIAYFTWGGSQPVEGLVTFEGTLKRGDRI